LAQAHDAREQKNYGTCGICSEEDKFLQNIIVPCGHNGYCMECITAWRKLHNECPFCRNEIREVVKMFDQIQAEAPDPVEEEKKGLKRM